MKQLLKFYFLFFTLLTTFFSFAQDGAITISGILLDQETNMPVPYASIYLKGKAIGTTSNSEGHFVFHVPLSQNSATVVISAMGYVSLERNVDLFEKDERITLSTKISELDEVQITAAKNKVLTAQQIVDRAYQSIERNYPDDPFILEGFIRDLQIEDSTAVEYLECAAKFSYQGYKVKKTPQVELIGVRTNLIAEKHPWNKGSERKNSIIDLVEDDFIRFDYGPITGKNGWKYKIDGILPYDNRVVYKITGVERPFQTAILYIDTETFAFVRMELTREAIKNRSWRRRFTNGALQVYYNVIFEYQEYNGKMYLKYQKEEDGWRIFKGLESRKVLFNRYPKKELFINTIITDNLDDYPFQRNMDASTSIENQMNGNNEKFWHTYNAPQRTRKQSKIIQELGKL